MIKIRIDNTDFLKKVSIINMDFVYLHHKNVKNYGCKGIIKTSDL